MMRRRWSAWMVVGLLAASCCVLATLQYRWIQDFSVTERQRLREDLQNRLSLFSHGFNEEISNAIAALSASQSEVDRDGSAAAYSARYQAWRSSQEQVIRRVALATPDGENVGLQLLNPSSGKFAPTAWPPEWSVTRQRLEMHVRGTSAPPQDRAESSLIEIPRFGGGMQEWLLLELNTDYIRSSVFPELRRKYLGDDYDAEVVVNSRPSEVIYQSGPNDLTSTADASTGLFEIQPRRTGPSRGGPPEGPPGRGPGGFAPQGDFGPRRPPPGDRDFPPQPNFEQRRWRLYARHRAGSLEALVARVKWRDISASGALLLLILAAAATLMWASRQSQRLAELQLNFVAGVSHELRTPLTVIRTAAFNLRGKLGSRPEQVEKYARLIEDESRRLTALVEQVLQFATSEADRLVRERRTVAIESVVESALESSRPAIEEKNVTVERHFDAALPPVWVDQSSIQHALQNLIDNAMKYGTELEDWIGISISSEEGWIEIRVADRGPGIPPDEQEHIFDPFYRGRRPRADQIHGAGLGLSLVKKIIEAHGGTVRVNSGPNGTEFIVRVPQAPAEQRHEFAHSLS
jgi:signal transduction histidine kinase